MGFNTIQNDIDLKHYRYYEIHGASFNTIQNDIDLKLR